MSAQHVLMAVGFLYCGSELALLIARRSRANVARRADRGSLAVLWITIGLSLFAAAQVAGRGLAPLPGAPLPWAIAGATLVVAGLVVRWTAIGTLRRAFTVDVSVAPGQRLVQRGLYRRLRHPAYAGNLLAFLGLALALDDWLAGLVLLLPITAAFLHRIRVEERALREAFGEEYESYCRRTWRLVPFVY